MTVPNEYGINNFGYIKVWEFWLDEQMSASQLELRSNPVTSSHVGHKF